VGPSVGVGVASAVILGGGLSLGAKYISAKGFGVAAAFIAQLLAMGLITGAVRSFEEAYAVNHDDVTTPKIWDVESSNGDVLSAFGFMGISKEFTALVLATFIVSTILISFYQIYHNYYGKAMIPTSIRLRMSAMMHDMFGGHPTKLDSQLDDHQVEIM
jgi:hypothetical protein